MLSIPTPTLSFESADASLATLEKPIQVLCGSVTRPNAGPLLPEHAAAAGLVAYRQITASSGRETWRHDTKEWVSGSPEPTELKPLPFFFLPDDPTFPWQGLVVAAGQKDKDGNDQFEPAVGGFPRYHFRAFFLQKNADVPSNNPSFGISAPTPDIQFINLLDRLRAGIRVDHGKKPENADEVHLFLRDASLQSLGSLSIKNVGNNAQIEMRKEATGSASDAIVRIMANGSIDILGPTTSLGQRARVRLNTSGNVEIRAVAGRPTRINDHLEVTATGNDVTVRCGGNLTLEASDITLNAETFSVNAVPVTVPWQVP